MSNFKIHFLKTLSGTLEVEADTLDEAIDNLERQEWSRLPIAWNDGPDYGVIELDKHTFEDPQNQAGDPNKIPF